MALVLVITPAERDLYGKPRGKPRVDEDYDAEYVVKGNTVDKIHSTGYTKLRWSITGSRAEAQVAQVNVGACPGET